MTTTVVHRREPHDVYIGRPSRWGNPFRIGRDGDREEVIRKYREYVLLRPHLIREIQRELRGRVLGCWCAPEDCHGHFLAWVADWKGSVASLVREARRVWP